MVAFILISIFSRQKQAEYKRNRQENRVDLEKPVQTTVQRSHEQSLANQRSPEPVRNLSHDDEMSPTRVKKRYDHKRGSQLPSQQTVESVSPLSVQPSTQDVIQGMMWAEVFGSPRSKKPYKPRTSFRHFR